MLPVWCRLWGLISIPALREESDPAPKINARTIKYFYPRPPRGERHKVAPHVFLAVHISIPALREESDRVCTARHKRKDRISIPALREESDIDCSEINRDTEFISIPALREESDKIVVQLIDGLGAFLSPPSARRATKALEEQRRREEISIPALREESDVHEQVTSSHTGISIPALREESDSIVLINFFDLLYFYPRPPRGERLQLTNGKRAAIPISIPALREESDLQCLVTWSSHRYFYPRPPRGERQQKQRQNLYFQTNYTTFCTNLEEL